MHDSNAARAKVAENYLKSTTGLWIVAPINRAVDDKAAKTLLGESFKKQLQMDGGFSSVTFICSKTDDISVLEAQDLLGLDEEIGTLEAEASVHRQEIEKLKRKVKDLKGVKSDHTEAADSTEDVLEVWEGLRDDCEAGKVVFAPTAKNKRKRGNASKNPRKKRRSSDSDSDYSEKNKSVSGSDDESDEEYNNRKRNKKDTESPEPTLKALTLEEIKAKLTALRASKKEARRCAREIDDQITPLRDKIDKLDDLIAQVDTKQRALCIAGRNKYSKGMLVVM